MSEKEKRIFIQKVGKICIATISLIILIISAWIIFDCFKPIPDKQNLIVNYGSSANADYKVYLKPNKFYDKKYLEKDKKYISNIIDYIDFDVEYSFNTSKAGKTQYSYSVTAKISSEYEVNGKSSELWSKSYVIKPNETKEVVSSSYFKVSENVKIDYA